jgi:hypothetical protein
MSYSTYGGVKIGKLEVPNKQMFVLAVILIYTLAIAVLIGINKVSILEAGSTADSPSSYQNKENIQMVSMLGVVAAGVAAMATVYNLKFVS